MIYLQLILCLLTLLPSIFTIEQQCIPNVQQIASEGDKHNIQNLPHETFFRTIFNVSDTINRTENIQNGTQICPDNSYCKHNGYCKCKSGYILDCQTKSHSLKIQKETFEIEKNHKLYFDVLPMKQDQYFAFRFNLCEVSSHNTDEKVEQKSEQEQQIYEIKIYADIGVMNQIQNKYQIMNASLPTGTGKCWYILTPILIFGSQKNGQHEQLIFTLQKKGKKAAQENMTQLSNETIRNLQQNMPSQQFEGIQKIELSVAQISIYSPQELFYANAIMVGMLVASSLMTLMTILLFWLRYRRNGRTFFDNTRFIPYDLSHFQKYIPKYTIRSQSKQILTKQSCSICILQFQVNDQVRKTHCDHIFHVKCLEEWCKNKLTCPICRGCLKKDSLKKYSIKKKITDFITKNPQKEQEIQKKQIQMFENQIIQTDNFDGIEEEDDPIQAQYHHKKGLIGQWINKVKRSQKRRMNRLKNQSGSVQSQ